MLLIKYKHNFFSKAKPPKKLFTASSKLFVIIREFFRLCADRRVAEAGNKYLVGLMNKLAFGKYNLTDELVMFIRSTEENVSELVLLFLFGH